MSIEALWAVRFGHIGNEQAGVNGGTIVLESGRLFGGDSTFAFVGHYDVHDQRVSGKIRAINHNPDPNFIDVWETGDKEFELAFSVEMSYDHKAGQGTITRNGFPAIGVRLARVAELP